MKKKVKIKRYIFIKWEIVKTNRLTLRESAALAQHRDKVAHITKKNTFPTKKKKRKNKRRRRIIADKFPLKNSEIYRVKIFTLKMNQLLPRIQFKFVLALFLQPLRQMNPPCV